MAEIVNLRRARKTRARMERAAEAEANRAAHGIAKASRETAKKLRDKHEREVDGHKIDD